MTTASGLMRHPVSLERSTTTVDTVGQTQKTWRVVERFWARVEIQSSNETLIGQQTGSYTQYEITTRKTTASVGDRIRHNDRLIEIDSVRELHYDQGLETLITGVERVA